MPIKIETSAPEEMVKNNKKVDNKKKVGKEEKAVKAEKPSKQKKKIEVEETDVKADNKKKENKKKEDAKNANGSNKEEQKDNNRVDSKKNDKKDNSKATNGKKRKAVDSDHEEEETAASSAKTNGTAAKTNGTAAKTNGTAAKTNGTAAKASTDGPASKKAKVEQKATTESKDDVELKRLTPAAWRKENFVDAPADTPDPVQQFADLQCPQYMKTALATLKYTKPTPIQSQAWPIGLSGRDMIGIAETGSGKTLAFLLPGLVAVKEKMLKKEIPAGYPGLVVMAPTRELAQQTQVVAQQLCRVLGMRTVCVYGGAPRREQGRKLSQGAEVVVATPGRLNDFLENQEISLKHTCFVVLDEADRMLDMGFEPQIATILKTIPEKHITHMFSATWPPEVRKLAAKYQNNPVKITLGNPENSGNKNIKQIIKVVTPFEKSQALTDLIKEIFKDNCRILIFTNTKAGCAEYAQMLWDAGMPSNAIHGDMIQQQRDRALYGFKSGQYPILFATDVAARGLDIKGVEYVVNFDMPLQVENYVHRIGRTGRAGQQGIAYSFFTLKDFDAHEYVRMLKESGGEVPPELEQLARRPKFSKTGAQAFYKSRGRFGSRQSDDSMGDSGRGWGGRGSRFGGRGGGGFRGGRGSRGGRW